MNSIAGSSIYACRNVSRHIVALEEDKAIFTALLAPLVRTLVACTSIHHATATIVDDLDGGDVVVERIVKKSRFSK